jgi:hypothetical protein
MSESSAERDTRLAVILEQARAELRRGTTPDVAAWQARHPDLADELPDLLATLRDLDTAADEWRWLASATRSFAPLAPVESATTAEPLPAWLGRYRILECIGAGGMGTVSKAEDPQLQRVVAIKVPRRDLLVADRRGVERFLREARAAARVHHPHVCPIHDVGEQDGLPYVVMAFVAGPALAERLRGGRFEDAREAADLGRQIAAGLSAVHGCGIVHRDLKPGNVLLDGGRAVLTDFGLARPEEAEQLTRVGAFLGTPAYVAPEQAAGEAEQVGPWSDLYSLGVVLYEMLTGRLPFEGPPLAVLARARTEAPPAPSRWRADLDPALEAIITRALAARPEERYRDAAALAADLGRWAAGEPVSAAPAPVPPAPAVRVELPDGRPVTISVAGGAPPEKMAVTVRERPGRGKRRRLAVTVTITFSLLLLLSLVGLSARLKWSGPPERVAQEVQEKDAGLALVLAKAKREQARGKQVSGSSRRMAKRATIPSPRRVGGVLAKKKREARAERIATAGRRPRPGVIPRAKHLRIHQGNPNSYFADGAGRQQPAYNVAVLGTAATSLPPYLLGYDPSPQAVNYGPSYPLVSGGYGSFVPSLGSRPSAVYLAGAGYGGMGGPGLALAPSGGYGSYALSTGTSPYLGGLAEGPGGVGGYGTPSTAPYGEYSLPTRSDLDPYGGYLRGMAAATSASGRPNLNIRQARLLQEQAARLARLDTRRTIMEARAYMYERPTYQATLALESADSGARAAPPAEIWSGQALNTLLGSIARSGKALSDGPNIRLDQDMLKHLNLMDAAMHGNVGLLKKSGKLEWPGPLLEKQFDAERKRVERNLQLVVQQRKEGKALERTTLPSIQADVKALTDKLLANVDELTPSQYIQARRFLNQLSDAVRALSDPRVTDYFKGNWTARGKTVAELVASMKKKELKFAPATPGDEASYLLLYRALHAFDAGLRGRAK